MTPSPPSLPSLCAALAGVLCLSVAPALAARPSSGGRLADPTQAVNRFARQPAGVSSTCFWGAPAGPLDAPVNALAPDTGVAYWYTRLSLPAGARLVLRGSFAHARFMELASYATVNGERGTVVSDLRDDQVRPDPGSANPFRAGASRADEARRSFTITVSGQTDPGPGRRRQNTLYARAGGRAGERAAIELGLRIYRADALRDMAGGVPLPRAVLTLPGGGRASGRAVCRDLRVHGGWAALSLANLGVPPSAYLRLLSLARPNPSAPRATLPALRTHPALDPPRFYRLFNQARALEPFLAGTLLQKEIAGLPTAPSQALYPTRGMFAVYAYADRTFGPDRRGHNILVLRGRMPTHPRTFAGERHNDLRGKQVRYWSLCNYGAASNPPLAPVNGECLFDEEIPTDGRGFYTIVVSLRGDRPRNATQRCGAVWMDWTPKGDGVRRGHHRLIMLAMRNLLPARSFAQGIDKVRVPGTERRVMGGYLPAGTYTTRSRFERRGCRRDV